MSKLQEGAKKDNGTLYSLEEIKAHNDFIDLTHTAVKELTANMITKEEADAAVKTAVKDQTQELQDKYGKLYEAALKQGMDLAKLKNVQSTGSNKDINDVQKQLVEQLEKSGSKSVFTKGVSQEMILKTEYTRASVASNPMGMMLAEIGQIGAPRMGLYDLFPKVPVEAESNGVIRYIDITTQTRNAATRAESSAYPESAIAFTGKTLNLQKIGDSIPITEEALRHTARLTAEISLFLDTNVRVAIESNLATGDGNDPNLKGVYTSATAYTATPQDIQDASIFDLIVKMSEDITGNATYGGKYMPDVIAMNITDINRMKLKKDNNNNYIIPPFASQDGKQVAGITVVENPFITANTCVLGDRRFARIYEEGTIESAYNYVNADFLQDVVTLKVRKFLALLVRDADVTGWRKCTDITTAIQTLSGLA